MSFTEELAKNGRILFSVLDITDWKRAERALAHSHNLMRYIIEHTRGEISVLDRDLRYIYVSQRYLDSYRLKEHDIIGKCHYDVFPDISEQIKDIHRRVLAGESISADDEPFNRADGTTDWVRWDCRPWHEADGSIGGLILYTEVVTERKQTELALRESEERFRSAFMTSPDSISISRLTDGVYLDINEGFTRVMGYTREDCIGKSSLEISIWDDPRDRNRLVAGMEEIGYVSNMEFRFRAKDGTVRTGLLSARNLPLNGEMCILSVIRDITDRKQAEEERTKLESQLQQAMKMEAVGRLAGGVAHDFNNLLTSIICNTELAEQELSPSDPLLHNLKETAKAAQSAASLTRQLLAFSRKQIIEPKVLNLNDLVGNVQKMLMRLIGEDIELKTVPGERLDSVKIDAGQFEQVLVNLAVNARDAMPDGGALTIETANIDLDESYCALHPQVQPGRYVMLVVSDTGHGMTDEVKKHLFEPFFTTKAIGRGTGLGLATTFGVVKQAGGSIDVYSEIGKGTTFRIFLPRVDEKASKLIRETPSLELLKGTETIFVVEDEPNLREMVIKILKRFGYSTLDAPNGDEAYMFGEKYTGRIDLLITDVVMPGMNGRELAEHLVVMHPEMKVLFTSGYTENVIVHHGVVDKNLNFIGKPYTPQGLAVKIREVLGPARK
jgi:PAS domain S-box-containing protein